MMFSVNSSLSALMAYGKKVGVHADNIANMYSNDFNRSRAIIKEGANHDVTVEIERVDSPEFPIMEINAGSTAENEPSAGDTTSQDSQLNHDSNNVNIATEIVETQIAQNAYEANIKILEAQKEMVGTILDLLS